MTSNEDRTLQLRIEAEFIEMPGLKLTLAQAARLFGVDQARCERLLGTLVDVGVLANPGRMFVGAGVGRQYL